MSFYASRVTKCIHLSQTKLFVLQHNITYNTKIKLKLMAFIEKLMSKRLIIGFSVGPLFVMTFPILFNVKIKINFIFLINI